MSTIPNKLDEKDIQLEGPCLWKYSEGIGPKCEQEPRKRGREKNFCGWHAERP